MDHIFVIGFGVFSGLLTAYVLYYTYKEAAKEDEEVREKIAKERPEPRSLFRRIRFKGGRT